MKAHLLSALSIAGLVALAPVVATAAGSDGPTPYDVTEAGVTLPDGETFPAHGHVNIRVDGEGFGIHFDPNNDQPGGAWIGESFIPWTAFGVDSGCVEWVQISNYNEHFGEGGQDPVCFGDEPEPEPGEDDSIPLIPLEPATPVEKDDPIPLTPLEPATPIEPVDDTPAPAPQEPVEIPQVKKPVTVPTGIPAGAPTPVVATPRMAG